MRGAGLWKRCLKLFLDDHLRLFGEEADEILGGLRFKEHALELPGRAGGAVDGAFALDEVGERGVPINLAGVLPLVVETPFVGELADENFIKAGRARARNSSGPRRCIAPK